MAKAPTSYIATAGAARTRTIDTLSFPLATRPQAMTMYYRFIDMDSPAVPLYKYLAVLGSDASGAVGAAGFSLYVTTGGATYSAAHANGSGTVRRATVTRTVTVGSLVELVATLTAAGVVQLSVSVNGGTVATGTATAALVLPPAWGQSTLAIGNVAQATNGLRDLIVVRGVHSLAAMRVRMGLTP